MACVTNYQQKTAFEIYDWCCKHGIYDVEKAKNYARRYCKGWYEFLLDSYNYDIVHALLAYDEAIHFCDQCDYAVMIFLQKIVCCEVYCYVSV